MTSMAPTTSASTRGGVPTLSQAPSQPPNAALATRGTVGAVGVDDAVVPTMIPTASGVPIASKWTSAADIQAASRQINYATLDAEERRAQDKWAKEKASEFAPCPANWLWSRHKTRELSGPSPLSSSCLFLLPAYFRLQPRYRISFLL